MQPVAVFEDSTRLAQLSALVTVSGQFSCPPPRNFVAVSGQFVVSAVTHDLNTSADESFVLENSWSAKGQDGTTSTGKETLAVLRKGPLLAYVQVIPGHQSMPSWPTAALVLPAAADDLNR